MRAAEFHALVERYIDKRFGAAPAEHPTAHA